MPATSAIFLSASAMDKVETYHYIRHQGTGKYKVICQRVKSWLMTKYARLIWKTVWIYQVMMLICSDVHVFGEEYCLLILGIFPSLLEDIECWREALNNVLCERPLGRLLSLQPKNFIYGEWSPHLQIRRTSILGVALIVKWKWPRKTLIYSGIWHHVISTRVFTKVPNSYRKEIFLPYFKL